MANTKVLQKLQKSHDKKYHQDVEQMTSDGQLRHIHYHLAKINGRLGDYLDKVDHIEYDKANKILDELKQRRFPDLFLLSLKLANVLDVDIEQAYRLRVKEAEENATGIGGKCCSCGYEGKTETPCTVREDQTHCEHWWDGSEEDQEIPAFSAKPQKQHNETNY